MRALARSSKRTDKPGLFRWLRSVAGNATVETVILIPVLVVIWGGIWYTHGRYRKAQNMTQFTRAHTWAYAYGGCRDEPNGSTRFSSRATDSSGFISGVSDLLFGSDALPGFRIAELEGRRTASIERPAVLGEGTVTTAHQLVLSCNERPRDDLDMFAGGWSIF